MRHAPEFDPMEFLRGEYWRLAEERRQRRLAQQAGRVAERHGAQGATATRESPARETPLRARQERS